MSDFRTRFNERLDELRDADQEIPVRAIAVANGITPQAVYGWINGTTKNPTPTNLLETARLIGLNADWLASGKKPKLLGAANTVIGPDRRPQIPIISWVKAGDWATVVDNFAPGQADEWHTPNAPVHQHTYALRVDGDSMKSPDGEPSFLHGQVIVVEPNLIDAPENLVGRLVIVRRHGDDEATFKKLARDAGRFYLMPLNPAYPRLELQKNDVFCGVVREKNVRYV